MAQTSTPATDQNNAARRFGFRYGPKGTHTTRTIMLDEIVMLLQSVPPDGTADDYSFATVEDNVTDKKTVATRRNTIQRLRELYGLDPAIPLFRILRRLWSIDSAGRPLLALLCALARDPLFRASAPVVLGLKVGEELSRQELTQALQAKWSDRWSDETLDKIARNISSSWSQSGHLNGRVRKIRQHIQPTPIVAAYALALGYMEGVRGNQLFRSLWAQCLDVSVGELIQLAKDAKRFGVLDLKQAGDVVEIGFSSLLSREEIRESHGAR
ncbi:MAG: hypothetical protein KDA91_19585 [Planctomycetaceae bacterium]|nr:hypothetical protein [Planctomycetaceae bacterium]